MALIPVLQRLVHRLPPGNAGSRRLEGPGQAGEDRPLLVDRLAQRVDHPADQGVADRHSQEFAGRGDRVALLDLGVVAQHDHAHGRLFQVQRDSLDVVLEGDHFAGHDPGESVNPRDAVTDLEHEPHLGTRDLGRELLDLTLDY